MTLEERKREAADFVLSIPSGKFDDDLFAPDFSAWTGAMGAFSGDVFRQQIPLVGAAFPDGMTMVVDRVIGEDRAVSVQARAWGVIAGGHDYRQDYLFVLEFDAEDRVRHFREYMDTEMVKKVMLPAIAGSNA